MKKPAHKCWCGSLATVINEGSDASPVHFACDDHGKEGWYPLSHAERYAEAVLTMLASS